MLKIQEEHMPSKKSSSNSKKFSSSWNSHKRSSAPRKAAILFKAANYKD